MDVSTSTKVDGVIAILMLLYGIAIVGNNPIMAVTGWLIGGLLVLRHAVEPFGEFVEENQMVFMLILLAILSVGFLLS